MTEKNINSRIIHKHDIEANWIKATNFIPLAGELIIYDADETYTHARLKVGDGVTLVNDLPFADESLIAKIEDLKTELSAQADWNQNDTNACDYVKNRTHYIEDTTKLILSETTIEIEEIGANGQTYIELADAMLPIYGDGRLYIVTIDGVSYRCNSWHYRGEPRIGDSRFLLESEPEYLWCPIDVPFLIDYYEEWGDWFPGEGGWGETTIYSGITLATTPGSHTIKIEEVTGSEYVPLDENYIPDTIARTADVQPKNLIVKYQEGSITQVTHNSIQIADAADAGVEVKFFDGLEYLSLLEYSREQYFAVFYTDYYDSSNILNIKYVLIDNTNNVLMADTSKHNVAFKTDLDKKQDKITGSSGQYAKFNSSGKLVGAALDLTEAKEYTDTKIADLVNSAPETLDTLGELATAFADNQDMVQTLNDAITNKADKADVMPADWNQNDENAADYVKNRTHWVEQKLEILVEETSEETIQSDALYYHTNYIVTVDGVQYPCTRYSDMSGGFALGDSRLIDLSGDTTNAIDVPFALSQYTMEMFGQDTDYLAIFFADTNPHTWSLATLSDEMEYHTLDERYIPDTIARTEHIHNNYGVCSTGASTAAKTVQIDGFELRVGAAVYVKFTNSNSASNPTLNVSGTGAKPMYRYGTTVMSTGTTTTGWSAGAVQVFIYDGTGWVRDYWNNSTYSNASLGQGYGTCSTAAATVAKTAALSSYALSTGGIVVIKFSNDVCANATLNVNSKGAKAIYYRGAAITDGVIKAGDIATFIYSTNYHLISIDSPSASVGVITNEEIDEICGGSIQYAEDVMF